MRRLFPTLVASAALALPAVAQAVDVWAPVPTTLPAAREGTAAILDSTRHRIVLLGGLTAAGAVNSTAVFDLTTHAWKDSASTNAPPPARYDHTAVWDAPRDRLLVFGGTNGATFMNDVWSLDLASLAWSQVSTSGTPPAARSDHVAVLDRAGDRMIVVGGASAGGILDDVVALDLSTNVWSPLAPSGQPPEARAGAAGAYTNGRTLLLYGGRGAITPDLADLWQLDLATLAWHPVVPVGGGASPAGRADDASAYDPVRNALVVSGGVTSSSTLLADTWVFYLPTQRWEQVTAAGPAARSGAAAAIADGAVIVVGGATAGGRQNDAWLLDLALRTWSSVPAPGTGPTARIDQSLASDDAHGRLLLFGGWLGTTFSTAINETWQLTYPSPASPGFVWQHLTTTGTPTGRFGHSAVIDPQRNRMLVFAGGSPTAFATNDLWALDLTTLAWTHITPNTASPPIRNNHAAVYDSLRQRMIVHGGFQSLSTALGDTWVYDCVANTWTQVATAPPMPAARSGHAYITDPLRDRMVIASGSAGSTYYHDTWALDYASLTWTQLTTSNDPIGWQSVPGIYDVPHDRMILFGGYNPATGATAGTWALDFATLQWSQLGPVGEVPGARLSHAMVRNPASGFAIMWGGNKGSTNYADGGVLYAWEPAPTAVWEPPSGRREPSPPALSASLRRDGSVGFQFDPVPDAAARIDITRVDGRAVASVSISRGIGHIIWNGRDGAARRAASGVYAARLVVDQRAVGAIRFVLLP